MLSLKDKMESHRQESIQKFLEIYKKDPNILAILLGGSIAHGFAQSDSDIDLLIVVDSGEYQKQKKSNKLTFSLKDICTYENGYIDCKVMDIDFLIKVSEYGSDPARYAFKDNIILFSKVNNLSDFLEKITSFPKDKKNEREKRFASRLLAWKWFYSEGVKKKNRYLVFLSLQKIVLFSSRIILNENELLYPFHKWMLEEVKTGTSKPNGYMDKVDELFESHTLDKVNKFCKEVLDFVKLDENAIDWPNYFLKDSEQKLARSRAAR